jgi:hypothetical protein
VKQVPDSIVVGVLDLVELDSGAPIHDLQAIWSPAETGRPGRTLRFGRHDSVRVAELTATGTTFSRSADTGVACELTAYMVRATLNHALCDESRAVRP